jgi:PAS domain S-box-containing protein
MERPSVLVWKSPIFSLRFSMIDEFLQERAALYVSGALSPREREHFELLLEFHDELRHFSKGLAEAGVAVLLAGLRPADFGPSPGLKGRVLEMIQDRSQQVTSAGLVVCNLDGLVQWINPAFIEMCGYSLQELQGKRLGPILQGEKTDRATAARMRRAVHEHRPCHETILNYSKNGEPYWVQIAMTPILDGVGRPHWLVAREHKLAEPIPA